MKCEACGKVEPWADGYALTRIYYDTIGCTSTILVCPRCSARMLSAVEIRAGDLKVKEATE